MTWEDDPYWTTDLSPGWTIRNDGEFVVDRRPPVSRIIQKIEGNYRKPLEVSARTKRPLPPPSDVQPRPGRTVFSTQPYHQRVRIHWREFLGV